MFYSDQLRCKLLYQQAFGVWILWNKPSNRSSIYSAHTHTHSLSREMAYDSCWGCTFTCIHAHKQSFSYHCCSHAQWLRADEVIVPTVGLILKTLCVCLCEQDRLYFPFSVPLSVLSSVPPLLSLLSSLFPLSSDLSIVLSASGPCRLFGGHHSGQLSDLCDGL